MNTWWKLAGGSAGPLRGLCTDDLTLNFSPVKGTQPSPVTVLVAAGCPSCSWASEELASVQPSLVLCPFIPMRETIHAGAGAEIHQLSCEQWTTFFLLTLNSDLVKKKIGQVAQGARAFSSDGARVGSEWWVWKALSDFMFSRCVQCYKNQKCVYCTGRYRGCCRLISLLCQPEKLWKSVLPSVDVLSIECTMY